MKEREKTPSSHSAGKILVIMSGMSLVLMSSSFADEDKSQSLLNSMHSEQMNEDNNYTVNFPNVPIVEYIKFVSKITNLNFVFHEEELQFNVTVVSEEPTSSKNILSALIQLLRVRNLNIIEQDNNLIISSNPAINQVPAIVAQDNNEPLSSSHPMVTRVFKIRNINPGSLAALIRPMISPGALVEVSPESKQLIVTDITTNINKIGLLLTSLDVPASNIEIDNYLAKFVDPEILISTVRQVMTPFTEGNPLLYVHNPENNSVFIVSTPYLIEKSISVFEDIDQSGQGVLSTINPAKQQVFVYHIQSKNPDVVVDSLMSMEQELASMPVPPVAVVEALKNVKYLKDTRSLVFVGDESTWAKIQSLLSTIDVANPFAQHNEFFIYKPKFVPAATLQAQLTQLATHLQSSKIGDADLLKTLSSMKWVSESQSLIFTGNEQSMAKLKSILASLDDPSNVESQHTSFFIYTPAHLPISILEKQIHDFSTHLKAEGGKDADLIKSLDTMKMVPDSNSLLFTGSEKTLARIQDFLKSMDVEGKKTSPNRVFMYKLQHARGDVILDNLRSLAKDFPKETLAERQTIDTINSIKWIKNNNSLLISGPESTVDEVKALVQEFDVASKHEAKGSFLIYEPRYVHPEFLENTLKDLANNLEQSGLSNPALLTTIAQMRYVPSSKSFVFTGGKEVLDELKTVLARIDVPPEQTNKIQPIGERSFFIYKLKYIDSDFLKKSLDSVSAHLQRSGADKDLAEAISSMRFIKENNSVIFVGTEESLSRLQKLIQNFDAQTTEGEPAPVQPASTFTIYRPKTKTGQELIKQMVEFATYLKSTGIPDADLFSTIDTLKYFPGTNSIVISGKPVAIERAQELLTEFDTGTGVQQQEGPPSNYAIYKPINRTGEDLITHVNHFADHLKTSGMANDDLLKTIANLKYFPSTNSIVITGDSKSIMQVEGLLKDFDNGHGVSSISGLSDKNFIVYKLQYHQGDEITTALKQVGTELSLSDPQSNKPLVDAINSAQWIKVTNSIIASGTPEILDRLRDLVSSLDVQLKQVFIEVLVLETSLQNSQNFGLQWGGKAKYLNKFATSYSNLPLGATQQVGSTFPNNLQNITGIRTPTGTDIPFTDGFDFGVIGDIIMHKGRSFLTLGSLVKAIQMDSDSNIVMNPKILAQDNKSSSIFIGSNLPFVASVITNNSANTTTTSNIEYRDIGTDLQITPYIGNSDIITLEIEQQITEVIGNVVNQVQTASVSGISTTKTNMSTRVHVPDGHFLVLSGMIKDRKEHVKTGLPCLGGLPVIGAAFSQNERLNHKNNILIFVRPHVIKGVEDYKKVTDNQVETYKDAAHLPVLKEEIDTGIDMVNKDDE